jgi:dihydrofolate reductase
VGRLIYGAIASLDGYVADDTGSFDWAQPDEEVHAFVNDLERPIKTYLYGRRMYEVMTYWETAGGVGEHALERDYAQLWREADKVVYSTTLDSVTTGRTRLERAFEADAVATLKDRSAGDLSIGGADLAGQALRAGLVDECHLFVVPVIVGGGTRWLPDGLRVELELLDERRFAGGTVHLHHRVGGHGA